MKKLVSSILIFAVVVAQLAGFGITASASAYEPYEGQKVYQLPDPTTYTGLGDWTTYMHTTPKFATDLNWMDFRGTIVASYDLYIPDFDSELESNKTLFSGSSSVMKFWYGEGNGDAFQLAGSPNIRSYKGQNAYEDGFHLRMVTQGGNTKYIIVKYDEDGNTAIDETFTPNWGSKDNGSSDTSTSDVDWAAGMFGRNGNKNIPLVGGTNGDGGKWIQMQTVLQKDSENDYNWTAINYINGEVVGGGKWANETINGQEVNARKAMISGFNGHAGKEQNAGATSGYGFTMQVVGSQAENGTTALQTEVKNIKFTVYGQENDPALSLETDSVGNTTVPEKVLVDGETIEIPVQNTHSGGQGYFIPSTVNQDSLTVKKYPKSDIFRTGEMIDVDSSLFWVVTNGKSTGSDVEGSGNSIILKPAPTITDWDTYNYVVTFDGIADIVGSMYSSTYPAGWDNTVGFNKKGMPFVNNTVILYQGEEPVIGKGEFLKLDDSLLETDENYLASKLKLTTNLEAGETIELCDSEDNEVASAITDENGMCTLILTNKILGSNEVYTIMNEGVSVGSFTTATASENVFSEIKTHNNGDNKTVANVYNLTGKDTDVYTVISRLNSNSVQDIEVIKHTAVKNGIAVVTTDRELTGTGDTYTAISFDGFNSEVAIPDKSIVSVGDFEEGVTTVTTNTGDKSVPQKLAVFNGSWAATPNNDTCKEMVKMVMDATTDDVDGKATFILDFRNLSSGTYVFAVYSKNSVYYTTVTYADTTDNDAALDLLNTKNSVTEIKTAIGEEGLNISIDTFLEHLEVGFDDYAFNDEQKEEILTDVIEHRKMKSLLFDRLSVKDIFKKYSALKALETKKTTKIENIAENFDIFTNSGDVKNWYNYRNQIDGDSQVSTNITDAWRIVVYNKVSKKFDFDYNNSMTKIEIFENAVRDELLLAIVAGAESTKQLKAALGDFQAKVSLNSDLIGKDKVLNSIWKKTYVTVSELKAAMQNSNNQDNYTPTTGGFGGGGGGTKYNDMYFENEPTPIEPNTPQMAGAIFSDVGSNHWAKEYIEELYEKGIVSGTSENEFSPSNNVKREEFVKMIVNASRLEIKDYKPKFIDVRLEDWYSTYVITALEYGLINGVSDDSFGVGEDITRQDIAVILYKALGDKFGNVEGTLEFADINKISEYAIEAVRVLSSLKIINGYEDGTFRGRAKATRAESAKMICEFLKIYAK